MASTLAKIRKQRLQKVEKLRKMGVDPYPPKGTKTKKNKYIVQNYDRKYHGKDKIEAVTGRIKSWREHGNLIFSDIEDESGTIQIIFRKDKLENKFDKDQQILGWKELDFFDIGDFIQIKGKVIASKSGEISIDADEVKLLTKAIRPLPDKWEGIKDIEYKLRRRYLDLAMNKQVRDMFIQKGNFWNHMRDYMHREGFLEVRTPVLEHTTGGADATPFVTHHNALDTDFYLRISLELPLKRAIGGGFEKVFEIGPVFRNEGIDDEHLQDYDMMEFYWAYADYEQSMDLVEEMYKYIALKTFDTLKFEIYGNKVDFEPKWPHIDYVQSIKEKFSIDVQKANEKQLRKKLKSLNAKFELNDRKPRLVDILWKQVRKDIVGPVFLVNHPKFVSPLSKSKFESPNITERYQIILGGSEMGNGYSELNDPIDQYERFKKQQDMRDSGDDEAQMLDIDFVEMLEYGMPPVTGFGVGSRLFSFLKDKPIRHTAMFPQMRRVLDETTKEIYGIERYKKPTTTIRNEFEQKIQKLRYKLSTDSIEEIEDKSIISIDEKIQENYENVNVGFAIIKGIEVNKTDKELEKLKEKVYAGIEETLAAEDIDDIPEIESYRQMYEKMGVDTSSRKSSPEAMLRRIVQGDELYTVNTCVDAYNLAVLLTQVSAGAFNIDKLKFPIKLREAKDGEQIEIIGGEKKKLKEGEVCYFDQNGAYNIDFNFRDAERTKVDENTKDIMINVEGVNNISREQVADALKLTVELITRFCGGEVDEMGLLTTNSQPSADKSDSTADFTDFDETKFIEPGITREKALELVKKSCKKENMIKHMLASEAAVEEYAKKFVKEGKLHKDNVETWKIAGLLHDITFEDDPDNHWNSAAEKLSQMGVSDYVTQAIRAHGNDDYTKHKTLLDDVLLLAEHSTGLVVTTALVIPSKKLKDVKVSSVVKKMKDKRFAASIDRDVIKTGAEKLGLTLKEHFKIVLDGMMRISRNLGL